MLSGSSECHLGAGTQGFYLQGLCSADWATTLALLHPGRKSPAPTHRLMWLVGVGSVISLAGPKAWPCAEKNACLALVGTMSLTCALRTGLSLKPVFSVNKPAWRRPDRADLSPGRYPWAVPGLTRSPTVQGYSPVFQCPLAPSKREWLWGMCSNTARV